MADLGIVEDLLEQIVSALQVGTLFDQHPAYSVYSDARMDDGKNCLVLSSVRDHNHPPGMQALQQNIKLCSKLAVRDQPHLQVACQRGDLHGLAGERKLVVYLYASEDGIDIRILRVGHAKLECCVDIGLPAHNRTHDSALAAQIVVAVNTEHQDIHGLLFEKIVLKGFCREKIYI